MRCSGRKGRSLLSILGVECPFWVEISIVINKALIPTSVIRNIRVVLYSAPVGVEPEFKEQMRFLSEIV